MTSPLVIAPRLGISLTMRRPGRVSAAAFGMAAVMIMAHAPVVCAQQPPVPSAPVPPASGPKPAKPAAATTKPTGTATAPSGGDSGLRQRIENLEEQLVDMQVVLGTLETLARSNGAASASPTYRAGGGATETGGGIETARISGLESQVRSLTQQVQQLTEQIRSQGGQAPAPRRDAALSSGGFSPSVATPSAPAPNTPPGWAASPQAPGRDVPARDAAFGAGEAGGTPLPPIAAAAPAGDGAGSKQAYESAYQFLLQQDYGAAETAFDEFLKRYPNDPLSGNAQFWLGESYFVRGQYKAAAGAFLKGYQTYGRSSKAPDSLLKLAMSLGRLGQKDSACSSLNELTTRFPQATNDVKSRAAAEKQRTGCP
jgi:tol-pal system protein YbgF